MLRWSIAIAIGCSSPPRPISISNSKAAVPESDHSCGFKTFDLLDRDAWNVVRPGQHPSFEPSIGVGTCQLFRIARDTYVLRDGTVDVAEITNYGSMMLVPAFSWGDLKVGISTDRVLEAFPADQYGIGCQRVARGTLCGFGLRGVECCNAMYEFLVDRVEDGFLVEGRTDDTLDRELFRGKVVRGVKILKRLD